MGTTRTTHGTVLRTTRASGDAKRPTPCFRRGKDLVIPPWKTPDLLSRLELPVQHAVLLPRMEE